MSKNYCLKFFKQFWIINLFFLFKIQLVYDKTIHQKELHIGGIFPMEAGIGGWPGGQVNYPFFFYLFYVKFFFLSILIVKKI